MVSPLFFFFFFFFCLALPSGGAPVTTTVIPLEGDFSTTAAHHEARIALRDSLIDAGTGYGGSQLFLCGRCPVAVHDGQKRYHLHALEIDTDNALHMLFCDRSALSPCASNLTVHHDNVTEVDTASRKDALAVHLLTLLNSKRIVPGTIKIGKRWTATPY